jgi:hypothetical protein
LDLPFGHETLTKRDRFSALNGRIGNLSYGVMALIGVHDAFRMPVAENDKRKSAPGTNTLGKLFEGIAACGKGGG